MLISTVCVWSVDCPTSTIPTACSAYYAAAPAAPAHLLIPPIATLVTRPSRSLPITMGSVTAVAKTPASIVSPLSFPLAYNVRQAILSSMAYATHATPTANSVLSLPTGIIAAINATLDTPLLQTATAWSAGTAVCNVLNIHLRSVSLAQTDFT